MNKRWPTFLLALGLIAFPAIALGQPSKPTSAPPAPRVETVQPKKNFVWVAGYWEWKDNNWVWAVGHWEKEHRGKRWRPHKWEQQGGAWVRVDGGWDVLPDVPNIAPPAIRVERVTPKRGQVFVAGHWDWKNYQWVWTKGHWEATRPGKRFVGGHWDQKGDSWVWVSENWGDAPDPINAPPAPQAEQRGKRNGFVWVAGHYTWENGEYAWDKGHWEKVRPNFQWSDGRWEQQGNRWVWIDGAWKEVVIAANPNMAPPAPKPETFKPRRGFIWIAGFYSWKNGQYEWVAGHWEREKPRKRWSDGRWEQQNGKWVWTDGTWGDLPAPYKFDANGWTLLGSADVWGRRDRDTLKINKPKLKFDQVTMVVTDSDLSLDHLVITFGNGEQFAPDVKHGFKEGARTRAIDLPGNDRFIKTIDVQYSNLPGGGRAHVEFYGRNVGNNQGGGNAGGGWKFDNKGWTLIGNADVFGKNDHDSIPVGKYQGRFDQLTMVVADSDLTLDDFVVTFGNGEVYDPKLRFVFKEGSRSRAIDLPGDDRFIKKIDVKYSNLPGSGRARVEIYGRDTGRPRPKPVNPGTTTTTGSTSTTTTTTTVTTGGGGVTVTVTGPTAAPPPLKVEKPGAKQGFIWVNGRWDWRDGKYEWFAGHWERSRQGKTWADGRWEKKGTVYIWVDGGWR